jgi:lactoylglutathione lyase
MKEIISIGHVALKVKDIEKSLAFYTQKMGFPEMFRLNREDGRVWLVYLRITDDQYLEIFPEAVQDSAPGPENNGINHFCLTVENIENLIRQLSEKDVPLHLPLKTGADNNRQAWVRDPDGNRIEFMEMSPEALQFKAIQSLRGATR